jgi:hypothetical protein
MGLRPTRGNENPRRHPRASGGPPPEEMDSRFRGNDVTFGGLARNLALRRQFDARVKQNEIPLP